MITYCVKRENDHCNEIIVSGLTFTEAQLAVLDNPGSWIEEDFDPFEELYWDMER